MENRMSVQTKAQDPVCGMLVDETSAPGHSIYGGRDYYFCCPRCEGLFNEDPERYIASSSKMPIVAGDNCGCGCGESTATNKPLVQLGGTLPLTTSSAPGPILHHDPVCGMDIEEQDAVGSLEYQGSRYYFCSQSCLQRFQQDPERYLHPNEAPTSPPNAHQIEYTCPMDPEVRQIGPGVCPNL